MRDYEQAWTAESKDSEAARYEPPRIVIIGPLEEITLGTLSKGNDPGFPAGKN